MAKANPFEGAVTTGVVAEDGLYRVIQRLKNGKRSIGTFFEQDRPKGSVMLSETALASLVAQDKASKGQPATWPEAPEKVPAATKASLEARIAELEALIAKAAS